MSQSKNFENDREGRVTNLRIIIPHSQKHHRPAAWCGFYRLAANCQQVRGSAQKFEYTC